MMARLVSLEHELHREKRKMADKQKVIEAQVQTIQALDAANNRLLTALAQLRSDTPPPTDENPHDDPTAATATAAAAPSVVGSLSLARRILADLGEVQSSSCWKYQSYLLLFLITCRFSL